LNHCDYDGIARIKRPNKGKRFTSELELRMAYDQVIREINLKMLPVVHNTSLCGGRWSISLEANTFNKYIFNFKMP
jgi:hypothetical protein